MTNYSNHYEETVNIIAKPEEIFSYADDFNNFSSHMNKSSWMMAGSKMETSTDGGKGKKVGSHIKMQGKILGFNLFLDEVITKHIFPYHKEWETVGDINLIVIDHYKLGFEISSEDNNSKLRIYIDYNLPKSALLHFAGLVFGGVYAKWCVRQMINGVGSHFNR